MKVEPLGHWLKVMGLESVRMQTWVTWLNPPNHCTRLPPRSGCTTESQRR